MMTMHRMLESGGELFWFKGALVNIRVSWIAGRIASVWWSTYMPYGMSPPLHVHRNEDEVFHILEGSMRIQVDGVESIAHAGQTVMAPKGVPHSFRVESRGRRPLPDDHVGRRPGAHDPRESASRQPGHAAWRSESEPGEAVSPALARCCARNGIDIVGEPLS